MVVTLFLGAAANVVTLLKKLVFCFAIYCNFNTNFCIFFTYSTQTYIIGCEMFSFIIELYLLIVYKKTITQDELVIYYLFYGNCINTSFTSIYQGSQGIKCGASFNIFISTAFAFTNIVFA